MSGAAASCEEKDEKAKEPPAEPMMDIYGLLDDGMIVDLNEYDKNQAIQVEVQDLLITLDDGYTFSVNDLILSYYE